MSEDQSSLDPFDENSDAEIDNRRWKGLLYVFPLCYYWIIVFLLGEESRQKPKVFCNVSLSRYVFNGGFHLSCFQWLKVTKMKANHNCNRIEPKRREAVSNGPKLLK